MTSKNDASLYGIPRPKRPAGKEISSSTSLSFSSQLSSLLSASNSTNSESRTSFGRTRPTKKEDIFSQHNRGSRKRAAKDLEVDSTTAQKRKSDIGHVDEADLHRSKRKMEEKARLYAAMKRGDYVPLGFSSIGDNSREANALVDFDRKWTEQEARGEQANYDTSSGDDSGGSDNEGDNVEYTDEFGRQRYGTRAEAAREERRQHGANNAAEEPVMLGARPSAPANLIYGDAIQHAAFNPDEPIARQMAELAAKRDRTPTPPPDLHYDASKEVRSKGVGFYQFSLDKEGRKGEMDALERQRLETERERKVLDEKNQKRIRELEERKRKIREKRGKRDADKFLDELGGQILPGNTTTEQTNDAKSV